MRGASDSGSALPSVGGGSLTNWATKDSRGCRTARVRTMVREVHETCTKHQQGYNDSVLEAVSAHVHN